MSHHPCIDELTLQDADMAKEAHIWREAISHVRDKTSARAVAHKALRYANAQVLPHLHEEERVLSSVLREHVGLTPLVHREREAMQKVVADCRRVADDIRRGADCRGAVEALADDVRSLARFEAQEYLPWAQKVLGDPLLREADARWRAYGKVQAQPRYPGIHRMLAS